MSLAKVTASAKQRERGSREGEERKSPYRSTRSHAIIAVTEVRQSDIRPPAP